MDSLNKISRTKILLFVFGIITVQLVVSAVFLATKKSGYFCDDIYSYGYANSDGLLTPLSYDTDSVTSDTIMSNIWLNPVILKDYMTVSKDEIFSYAGILKTLRRDAHPPLFYFLLHFICSFSPGVFSVWSAFIINAIGFILIQVYLYRLTLLISQNRTIALMVITFFGFTSGTISMMCFLRMYILAEGFTLGFAFYSFRYMLYPDKKMITKNLILAGAMLYMGAMTVYLSIIFAFFLTLSICLILLIRKQIKQSLCFGFTMLISILLMFISFPAVKNQLLYDQPALGRSEQYPYLLQLRMGLHVITDALFGLGTPVFPSMIPLYILWGLIGLAIIYALVAFLFREDSFFLDFKKKVLSSFVSTLKKTKKYAYSLLPIFLCCAVILLIFAKKLMLYYYTYSGIRYTYFLTPFIAMTVFITLFKLIKQTPIQIAILLLLTSLSFLRGQKTFLQSTYMTKEIAAVTTNANVIVVETAAPYFIYHIMDLTDCDSFLYTTPKNLYEHTSDRIIHEKDDDDNDLLLMVDINAYSLGPNTKKVYDASTGNEMIIGPSDNEVIQYFLSMPEYQHAEFVGDFSTCYIYRLK